MRRIFLSLFVISFCLVSLALSQQQRRKRRSPPSRQVIKPQPSPLRPSAKEPSQSVVRKPEAASDASPRKRNDDITVNAQLTRGQYRTGSISVPTWEVELTIRNNTAHEIQLGESLIVLEKIRNSPLWLASYLAREGAESGSHLTMLEPRYGLVWGVTYDKRHKAAAVHIPTRGQGGDILGFMAGITVLSYEPFAGLGYGRVAPNSERKIEVQVIAPYGTRNRDEQEYVSVILPRIHPAGADINNTTYSKAYQQELQEIEREAELKASAEAAKAGEQRRG